MSFVTFVQPATVTAFLLKFSTSDFFSLFIYLFIFTSYGDLDKNSATTKK